MPSLGLGLSLAKPIYTGASSSPPAPASNPALQSDDGNWYQIGGEEFAVDNVEFKIFPTPVLPGASAYLVLVNLDDGLKYKFRILGVPPIDDRWSIDDAPTLEAETPTTLEIGANNYTLDIIAQGDGFTIQLNLV